MKLHLYGKVTPKPGRKMGHLTAMGRTVHEAQERVIAARDALLSLGRPRRGAPGRALLDSATFQLDAGAPAALTHDGAPLTMTGASPRRAGGALARAGAVVSKDALVEAAWRDVAVTDNSLEQAVSSLRRALATAAAGDAYIETVPRQGYRFSGRSGA